MQRDVQDENNSEKIKEKNNTQTEENESNEIYKLPCKKVYIDSDGEVYENEFEFEFLDDEPSEEEINNFSEDTWYLILNEDNLISKVIKCYDRKHGEIYEADFEYNTDNLVSKITNTDYYNGDLTSRTTEIYTYSDNTKDKKIYSRDEFEYSNDDLQIIAKVEDGDEVDITDIIVNRNNWVLSCDGGDYCLSKNYKYDEYGNVIEFDNAVNRFTFENIQYDDYGNMISAQRCLYDIETNIKKDELVTNCNFIYDEDGYLDKAYMDDGACFEVKYAEYSEVEYNALKKISVLWFPAGFRYYNQPDIKWNYYKK